MSEPLYTRPRARANLAAGPSAAPATNALQVLLLNGLDDLSTATIISTRGGIKFRYDGNLNIFPEISHPALRATRLLLGTARQQPVKFPIPAVAFNCIADPDTHGRSLGLAERVLSEVKAPILNPPERIRATTRDNIYRLFRDTEGLKVPRTVRLAPRSRAEVAQALQEGAIAAPCLMRPAGDHGGHELILIRTPADLDQVERYPFTGQKAYYMSAFEDFAGADGLYRKYRLVVVDGVAYPRHLIVGRDWNIHSRTRGEFMAARPDAIAEERDFMDRCAEVLGERALKAVAEVHQTLGLDYFGIDCHLTPAGELLIFEINACVNVFEKNDAPFEHLNPRVETIRRAVEAMLLRRSGRV